MLDNGLKDKELIYDTFDYAFKNDPVSFTNPKSLAYYFITAYNLYKSGSDITLEDLFEKYEELTEKFQLLQINISRNLDKILNKEESGIALSSSETRNKKIYNTNSNGVILQGDNSSPTTTLQGGFTLQLAGKTYAEDDITLATGKTLTAPTINGVVGGTATSQTITTLTTSTISAGNLSVDSSGTITLDADSGAIDLADGGTQFGSLTNSSGNLIIKSGSTTAMTMSGANVTVAGNLTVEGTTTTVDSSTIQIQNAFVFEGATDDSSETTLTTVDPTADRTISLPNVSGTLPVLAAASTTQITSTPEELNLLDGVTATTTEINFLDGVTSNIQTQLDTALTSTTGATKAFAIAQAVALG